jgi:hypothetical protein
MTFADHVLAFNKSLRIKKKLPDGVGTMNPFQDKTAAVLSERFYKKYYNDTRRRAIILGINPGRHGGGITGVPFTDPGKLENICGIPNDLQKKAELSADFMYAMINAFGGPQKFYGKFYISGVSPLGFTKDGKNLNYYDIKELQRAIVDFIVDCLKAQLAFNITTDVCFCLGEGTNFKFLDALNRKHQFFERIVPLPHPRFIMQYRRKQIDSFIALYLEKLTEIVNR